MNLNAPLLLRVEFPLAFAEFKLLIFPLRVGRLSLFKRGRPVYFYRFEDDLQGGLGLHEKR